MFPISNFSRILYRYSKIPTSEQDIPIVEEFQKIDTMPAEELKEYIKTWSWLY